MKTQNSQSKSNYKKETIIDAIKKVSSNEGVFDRVRGTAINELKFFALIKYFAGEDYLEYSWYQSSNYQETFNIFTSIKLPKFVNSYHDLQEKYKSDFTGKDYKTAQKYLGLFIDIFNEYFVIKPNYVDVSYHGSPDYEETGYFDIIGRLPEIIGKKICKIFDEFVKHDQEKLIHIVKNLIDEHKKTELKNQTTKKYYDALEELENIM